MSLLPHREKDAKVEGRDLLETAPKETMEPFKRLMGRLLKVKPNEVAEQQHLYEERKSEQTSPPRLKKLKNKKSLISTKGNEAEEKKSAAKRTI